MLRLRLHSHRTILEIQVGTLQEHYLLHSEASPQIEGVQQVMIRLADCEQRVKFGLRVRFRLTLHVSRSVAAFRHASYAEELQDR